MTIFFSTSSRAITQKSVGWFRSREKTLFGRHDTKFGVTSLCDGGYSYSGEEHYRGLFNLVNHLEHHDSTRQERLTFLVRTVVLLRCLRAAGYFKGVKEICNRCGKIVVFIYISSLGPDAAV